MSERRRLVALPAARPRHPRIWSSPPGCRGLGGAEATSWVCVLLLIVLPGCATRHAPPALSAAPDRTPIESWALVLEERVDTEGRIDFAGLAEQPEDLRHFVAAVAAPRGGDDPSETIAFYVNAYNAVAMYNVIESGKLPRDLLGFFLLQQFVVDGDYISLYDLENDVIRPLGDPRVHFALNCMVRSCPRLRREPYEAGSLDDQLDEAAREFCNDERHVRVDHGRRRVELSRVMDFYTKDFLAETPSLIAYVNRYREAPIPEDYDVRFVKWDWTLNAQTRGAAASGAAPGGAVGRANAGGHGAFRSPAAQGAGRGAG